MKTLKYIFFLLIITLLSYNAYSQGCDTITPKTKADSIAKVNKLIEAKALINEIENNMAFVQGGTFTMGCTSEQGISDCSDDNDPAHSVTVSDYYIGKYEVTQKQWKAVMGSNPSYFKDCDNCPVEQVSWDDIQEFLKTLNAMTGKTYILPSEAQWEYASRGGNKNKGYKYSGSNNIKYVAWYAVKFQGHNHRTHKVGVKAPNELGTYDMSGNVWEWCSDWCGNYSSSSQTNPKGPETGLLRVIRGGSIDSVAWHCRVSGSGGIPPGSRNNDVGFRLVRVP